MDVTEKCRLCLCPHTNYNTLTRESDELRCIVDNIFSFPIFRQHDIETLLCESCVDTTHEYYCFIKKVEYNQELIKSTLNLLPPVSTTSSRSRTPLSIEDDKQEEWDKENFQLEIEYEQMVADGYTPRVEEVFLDETKVEKEDGEEGASTAGSVGEPDEEEEFTTFAELYEATESRSAKEEESNCGDDPAEVEYLEEEYESECQPEPNEAKPKPKPATEKTETTDREALEKEVLRHYQLTCDLCKQPVDDFGELKKHFKYTHETKGYLKCCNRKIYQKCAMVDHIQHHLNPDAFRCVKCNKSYSSGRVLREHMKEMHAPRESRTFQCKTCKKGFVSTRHLNSHIAVAHGDIPCPECPKTLASKGSLKHHLWSVHGEGANFKHICDFCAREFRNKLSLTTHLQTHQGTRLNNKVQCESCLAWFTDKNCLTKHVLRMHVQPSMEWKCKLCDKQLTNRHALNNHMSVTHNDGRFQCHVCEKRFKRPHHLREHVAIHHTGEDLYGCKHCEERFKSKNKQLAHRKSVHPEEYKEEMRKRIMKEPY